MATAIPVFTQHEGVVVPIDRANIDTDQIIPKQFLKSIKRTGFGDNLFDAWRFKDEGEIGVTLDQRIPNPDFVLNDERYGDGSILLARRNFGCGSSREHAVWALMQHGFRCVIAPSFADIFLSNCFKNGLLPIALDESTVDALMQLATQPTPIRIQVNLEDQTITTVGLGTIDFEINERQKNQLIAGLDEIGLTLKHSAEIERFEQRHRENSPWLF